MTAKLHNAKAAARSFMAGSYPDRKWFIIGGALRDTDLGLEFKDVDIFVSGFDTDPIPDGEVEDGARNAYLLRAFTVPWMGFELNIIFLRGVWDLKRATDRCDFGICQIGYDPEEDTTYRSEMYEYDVNGTLTLCRDTVPERKTRMAAKFPTFRYRNPQYFKVSYTSTSYHYNSDNGKLEEKPVFAQ